MDTYTLAQLVVTYQKTMYHVGSSQTFLQSVVDVCADILSRFENLTEARNYANDMSANGMLFTELGYAFDAAVLYDAIEFMAITRLWQ